MRRTALLLLALAAALTLTACAAPASVKEDGKLKIVATIWPEYEWVSAVLGDNPAGAEVTLLVDSGVDPHSFQPAVSDIMELYTCDLLLYLGAASDEWVGKALEGEVDPELAALPLMEALGDDLCAEEHDHGDHDHHDHGEYDEHIWLSLKKAQTLVHAIAHELGHIDPENAAYYGENAESYCAALAALDGEYAAVAEGAAYDTLVFADRFPFLYLTEDYGLHYEAAFPGCSAETEASFATITRLAGVVEEKGLPAVLTIDGSDGSIARTVVESAKGQPAEILTLNSMQSRLGEGDTYLSIMEENLEVLKQALQGGGSHVTTDLP